MAEKRSDTATTTREEHQTRPDTQTRQGTQAAQENQSRGSGQQRQQDITRQRSDTQLSRGGVPTFFTNPFALLGRLAEEMTGVFDEISAPGFSRSGAPAARRAWAPNTDVFQRGNELVVRADLPGMNPDDINIDVSDDAITLSGERHDEYRDERNGVYRFERSYGSFFRTIPLPEGTITDQAKATFKDGVLEITIPAPPEQVSRGRRLEISRGEERKPTST